jgi:hypothetical protein
VFFFCIPVTKIITQLEMSLIGDNHFDFDKYLKCASVQSKKLIQYNQITYINPLEYLLILPLVQQQNFATQLSLTSTDPEIGIIRNRKRNFNNTLF